MYICQYIRWIIVVRRRAIPCPRHRKMNKQDLPYPEESLSPQPHTPHPNWPPANNNDPGCMYIYIYKLYILYM